MPIGPAMTDIKDMADEPINDAISSADELMAGASAAARQVADSVKTFRGRSLEELIPRVRAELGADAIVLRSREELAGGFLGFFQKRYIEVEARAPLGHEQPDGDLARNDRATAEGLATPGIKALIDQAHPFASRLAAAQVEAVDRGRLLSARDVEVAAAAFADASAPVSAGLYGPQPNVDAVVRASVTAEQAPLEASEAFETDFRPDAILDPACREVAAPQAPVEPAAASALEAFVQDPADPVGPARVSRRTPSDAEGIRIRLAQSGLPADMAADLVGEAIDHFLPFAPARPLEAHVRTVLARRLSVLADLGPGARTMAFVGAGGSGKTSTAANLAVAYASAGSRVLCIALGDETDGRGLARRLKPLGIPVRVVGTGEAAGELIARERPDLTVIDVCDSADPAGLEALQSDLRAIDPDEVHLAVPATLSAAAAREEHSRQRILGVSHLCLTHADSTAHPGAPLALALDRDLPVSFLCTRASIAPADAEALADRLLP